MKHRKQEVIADKYFKDNWPQIKTELKKYFNLLTDKDLEFIDGKRELLIGKLMAYYDWDFEYARSLVNKFIYATK
jgi:uncharacterized protein YjbJ (UPF0337 family)